MKQSQLQQLDGALLVEWFDLRKQALQKLQQGACGLGAAEKELRSWDDVVLRFRKLREALTATAAPAAIRCEVYELSAVVCAAARNMAELLKCLQQLVNSIYPAQQRQQAAVVAQKQHWQQQAVAAATTTAAAAAAVHAVSAPQQHLDVLQDGQVLPRSEQQQQQQCAATSGQQQQQQQQCAASSGQQQQQQQLKHNAAYSYHLQQQQHDVEDFGNAADSQKLGKSSNSSRNSNLRSSSSSSSVFGDSAHERRIEVSAALLLYFVCVPRRPVVQELVKQLKAAGSVVICQPDVQQQQQQQRPGQQQQQQQCLLQSSVYQLATRAAAAVLNCNWVQFVRCYHSSNPSPPLLVKAIMECVLERLRVHTVHSVVIAYRMLPSSVLLRWMGLTSHAELQVAKVDYSAAAAAAAAAADECIKRQHLMRALLQAADGGCRGARTALDQCAACTAALPDTLQFRS